MRRHVAFAIALIGLPWGIQAQEWSPEQQEVWARVQECWAAFNLRADEATSLDCFHEDYSFWWSEDVLPFDKQMVRGFHRAFLGENDVELYDLRPSRIVVQGDVALVHWGARLWTDGPDGGQNVAVERISMTLVKEDGVWRYLGGGGSPHRY